MKNTHNSLIMVIYWQWIRECHQCLILLFLWGFVFNINGMAKIP